MRIGAMTGIIAQAFSPSSNRTIAQKTVPFFMQPLYFDLVVNAYQLQITARLGQHGAKSCRPSDPDAESTGNLQDKQHRLDRCERHISGRVLSL